MENQKNNLEINSNKGFSLTEVLVALALASIVFGMALTQSFTDSEKLDELITAVEKGIRYGSDETALKGTIVRLKFNFDTTPQTYALEYGPKGNFVLPGHVTQENKDLTEREQEELDEKEGKLKKKFNKIRSFNEKDVELHEVIRLIGVGTTLKEGLVLDGEASVYMYPTGEKDGAIIFFSTSEEMVAMKVEPFSNTVSSEFITLDDVETDELEEKQIALAKTLYEKWLKD